MTETTKQECVHKTPREHVLDIFEQRGLRYITPEELGTLNPKLHNMLSRFHRNGESGILDKMLTFQDKKDTNRFVVKLYTSGHVYSISCRVCGEKDYLGCIASSRKYRVGEDWTRGNDLADGPFTENTFTEIVFDILGYELMDLEL